MFTAYYVLTNKEALVFSRALEPQMRPWVLMPAVSAVIGRTLELDQLGNLALPLMGLDWLVGGCCCLTWG